MYHSLCDSQGLYATRDPGGKFLEYPKNKIPNPHNLLRLSPLLVSGLCEDHSLGNLFLWETE